MTAPFETAPECNFGRDKSPSHYLRSRTDALSDTASELLNLSQVQ